MEQLKVIEVQGQRVLTTKQIAEMYGAEEEKIRWNFKYNRKKFIAGKHFILIEGEELRKMKRECEFQTLFKQAKSVCFWTEKGALLHAKSLNTDKAWEVYDYLVDFYFRTKENRTQEIRKQEPEGKAVVNIPENVEIQNALNETRKYLTAVDVALSEYNMYVNEGDYEKSKDALSCMVCGFFIRAGKLLDIKPKIVRKII